MTDIVQLFSGVGILIDEAFYETGKQKNGIQKIADSLKEKGLPYVAFQELPISFVKQFHSVSFVVLDWNLSGVQPIPQATIEDNIEFINQFQSSCFAPLFIFSDEDPRDIQVTLESRNLFYEGCPVFIKKKEELVSSERLFGEIEGWLRKTPSIYVLKEWEKTTREAKIKMMWSLSAISPAWPSILSRAIGLDGGDSSSELMKLLHNNLSYRMDNLSFDDEIINVGLGGINKDDLRRLLECERFLPKSLLPEHPFSGDVFLIEGKYYINIRPDCDIIRDFAQKDMYLIRGNVVDEATINVEGKAGQDTILFEKGAFVEKINCSYVAFISGQILRLSFREIYQRKWKEIKESRIGRLLPPYITAIQQKYAAYLQRQGLPGIPKEAIE